MCDPACVHRLLHEGWLTVCKQSREESLSLVISKSEFRIWDSETTLNEWDNSWMDRDNVAVTTLWTMNNLINSLSPAIATAVSSFYIQLDGWQLTSTPPFTAQALVQVWGNIQKHKARMHPDCKITVGIVFLLADCRHLGFDVDLPLGQKDGVRSAIRQKADFYDQKEIKLEKEGKGAYRRRYFGPYADAIIKVMERLGE